jgi:hypothetical protein
LRHGKIVTEAYYAPYAAGIPHAIYSATKAVISTLTAIVSKDGLLDSPNHRVLDFFDHSSIANVDDQKEICLQTKYVMSRPRSRLKSARPRESQLETRGDAISNATSKPKSMTHCGIIWSLI